MKKILMMGIATISTSFAFSVANATTVKSTRELLVDYTKQAREHVYGKAGSAKGVNASVLNEVKETLLKQLEIPGMASKIRPALSGPAAVERMDNLVTIVAAKKMSVEIAKKDVGEGQSIDAAANASVKLIANGDTVGAKKSTALSPQEASLVAEALRKAESLPTRILTEFSRTERDSYTQVIERYDQLNQTGAKNSAEDSFIQAIMEVKRVDRTKALEIAQKLKECV